MKRHNISRSEGIEMTTRPRGKSDAPQYKGPFYDPADDSYAGQSSSNEWTAGASGVSRSRSTGHKVADGLKKRLGSIRRKHKERSE